MRACRASRVARVRARLLQPGTDDVRHHLSTARLEVDLPSVELGVADPFGQPVERELRRLITRRSDALHHVAEAPGAVRGVLRTSVANHSLVDDLELTKALQVDVARCGRIVVGGTVTTRRDGETDHDADQRAPPN